MGDQMLVTTEDDSKCQNLKTNIKYFALTHSKEISAVMKSDLKKREFPVVKNAQELMSLKCFNGCDESVIVNEVQTIEETVKNILDSGILVNDEGIEELVPVSYQVLNFIFNSTDERFRQHYFKELVEYYYNELSRNRNSMSTILSEADFHQQVKVFLPIIKLETALKLINDKDPGSNKLFKEIESNLMSFFKYPRLNQEDIYAVVNKKLNSNNYELLSYEMSSLDERNGHLGDYFKLKINVEFENTERVLNLFAKFLTPKLEAWKELVKSGPSKKEEFFYMTYIPFLERHGLHSLLDFSPKCYLSRVNDVLVLDDMVSLGFSALTPNIKLEFEGLMFVIKQIAKLHSCSMILEELLSKKEDKKVTLDQMFSEYLQEAVFDLNNKFLKESFEAALAKIHYLAEKFSELNKKFTTRELINKIDVAWNLIIKQLKKSVRFKNTICHGDMYVGNMLFKFDTNQTCLDATLVDFQILRYCPPVHDILFFIYQNSLKETRDKHFRELLDGYYLELSKHLKSFNLDIAKIYSKREFEESLKYMKSQGLLQALYYSPFNSLDPNLREEIMGNPEMAQKYFFGEITALIDLGLENSAYKEVIGGLMEDLIELCENGLM